jgi:outer membrane protein OmpA-like peptidoglycan-associated protein
MNRSGYWLLATSAIGVFAVSACSHHPAKQAYTPPTDVQVFFDTGSSALTDAATRTLDQAARFYRDGGPIGTFVVTGYADISGGEYANLLLSGRRALAAKEALVARGIPAARLQLQVVASSFPRHPEAAEPDNDRRVVISWH